MPQYPIGVLDMGRGVKRILNITAAGVIVPIFGAAPPSSALRLAQLSVLSAGSGGAPLVINDATTLAGAITPTEVWNAATAASATINMPLTSGGFVVSSLPANARIAISYE